MIRSVYIYLYFVLAPRFGNIASAWTRKEDSVSQIDKPCPRGVIMRKLDFDQAGEVQGSG